MKALAFLLAMAACAGQAAAEPMIRLLYQERPPYNVRSGDAVEGLTGTPAEAAFRKAAIAFTWEAASMSRQMRMLRDNQSADCVCGWYKTSERLQFAKYTQAIYRGHPTVGLLRQGYALAPGKTLEQALATPGLRLLVRDMYSYGEHIDSLIRRLKPTLITSKLPNLQLAGLIKAGRADLMFADQEEADLLVRQQQLSVVRFADIAQGIERHIVCSRKVPDAVIERLNKAIASAR